MAEKTSTTKKARHHLNSAVNRGREVKEVATKLRHLPPTAKAEVVNTMVGRSVSQQFSGFGNFLREQSVVGVGIGIVFGAQVKAVVDTLMASFVNPVTVLLLPGGALSKQIVEVHLHGKTAKIGWGSIVYSLLTFIIVALIIYMTYKLLKLDRFKKKDK
jgi:large-conductance mechanosensitive channel